MSELKKYTDIVRLGHSSTRDVLNKGDYITITEKLDGANASFILNENGSMNYFSRRQKVTEENHLRGYYKWAKDNINPELLNSKYRYFGEWLTSHKIQYKQEFYNNFYLFNIYDEELEEYLPDSIMRSEADRLGIKPVPLFYEGEYVSFEHLSSFIGKSDMAISHGEGIVVKNVNYKNRYGSQLFVKLVHEKFIEVQKQKPPKDPNKTTPEREFVNMCLTKPRIEKLLYKLVDEGILDEEFGIEDMALILKNLGGKVYDDIFKEESDSLPEGYDEKLIKSAIGKALPLKVKEIIKEKYV